MSKVLPYAQGMLVGRTGLSPVMIGRAAELDRLAGLVGSARAPRVALVAGEPGIGKTRLLQEFVREVPEGMLVLTGQADSDTASRPLALLVDILSSARSSDVVDVVDAELDDLDSTVRDGDRATDERILAAVELVRRLAAGVSSVLVFEDLHWADPESLTVFERLAEPDDSSRLLVGTYRPDGLSRRHPASDLLPRLERRHSVTHLHLQRLSAADISNFLEAVYGELPTYRAVKALQTRTGGNPFFLEELIAAAPDDSRWCDLDSTPLPWTMAELVRNQLDELDPEVRRIVTAASELGRRIPFDVLAAVTASSEDDLIALLRAAVDSGLLVEAEEDVFGFHHEIAREAVAEGMLGRERRRLHEAALDFLRQAGSTDHAALARHALCASRFGDMIEEARLGAHSYLAHGSSYQALQLAEMALDEAVDDLDLLAVATRAAWLVGLLDDAAEHADRWLGLARQADEVSEEAEALSLRMRVAFDAGHMEAMASDADALADLVDRLPTDEERARAMAVLAQSYMLRDQVEPTCEWADKASELADAHGIDAVRVAAMVEKGSVLVNDPATADEGRALLEAAIAESGRIGEHVLAARALNNLVWRALGRDDADEVRKLIDRQRGHAKAAGLVTSGHTQALAQLAAVEGDLDAAIAQVDEQELTTSVGHAAWKGRWTAVLRAGYALEAGDLDTAERYTAVAKPPMERTAAAVTGLEIHIACRRGEVDTARASLADLLDAIDTDGHGSPSQAHDIVAAALHAGLRSDELQPLIDRVGFYAGHRLDPEHPWRRYLDAQLAESEGRVGEAAELYIEATRTLGTNLVVLAGARGTAHVGAARCLVALGRIDDARAHATSAAAHLARWRGWRVDELRAVERRLGIGPEPSGPTALTPRERDVVGLLAEGLTNSQLAERLFISPRTAAVHVSNILAKLGMSSRTEIAAWAGAGGLDQG